MIRVIIADDERPSLDRLEKLLLNSGMVEVTGKFTDASDVLAFIKVNRADAVFIDIEMPDMNGIELANLILDIQENIAVVFVTAYHQYAAEAFGLNALDYLLKPVSKDRLMETLRRISKRISVKIHPIRLRIQCFGKFRVTAGEDEIRFRTEKAEELLAFLIDQQGAYVSRTRIIDNLWEDFDADRAIVHFNTTLHYVKKALLPFGIHISIEFDRGSYRLDTGSLDCDYLKFCAFGGNNGVIGKETIAAFEKAAAFYTGEYLLGCDCTWAAGKRLLLEEQFIGLLLSIAAYYTKIKKHGETIKWLKTGLLHEPLHREMNYRFIESLLAANERVMAAKYYEFYRSGLMKRLKQEPDEEFRKLME